MLITGLRPGIRLAVLAAAVVLAAPAAALEDGPVYVRGEIARLARQAYDYNYRNSNRNVFRRSRHFHPTKNVFRSSRYYRDRLAASYAGYPLRTVVHHGHHSGEHGEHLFVYPRRQPYGPSLDGYYLGPEYGDLGWGDRSVEPDPAAEEPERRRPRSREEIEMVEIRVVEREPTQRAVLKTVIRPDGTVHTVITSEPIEE